MGEVFDRWRLNQGWNPWDNATQMAAIASYVYTLDLHKVPASAYGELYERVLNSRVTALQSGKQVPNFGVELMVAEWVGPHGLRSEMAEREIAAGRTLTATSQTNCLRCFGTGMETVYGDDGRALGVRPGCKHEFVDDSPPTADGLEAMADALRSKTPAETAPEICRRVHRGLMLQFLRGESEAEQQRAWAAAGTWLRAARYLEGQAALD